jgi:hypothetical protein
MHNTTTTGGTTMNPTELTAEEVVPVHDYGIRPITHGLMGEIRTRDADAYTPTGYTKTWTQAEATRAIVDRHHLMSALSQTLEALAKLTPRVIEKWTDADCLPEGTIVVEANGEISTIHHQGGEHYWRSVGDETRYRSTRLTYPVKVLPMTVGAWIEEDEARAAQAGTD